MQTAAHPTTQPVDQDREACALAALHRLAKRAGWTRAQVRRAREACRLALAIVQEAEAAS